MCRLRNIAMRDYQESVTTGQTHGRTDAGQSDPYVPLCFAGDTKSLLCKDLINSITGTSLGLLAPFSMQKYNVFVKHYVPAATKSI